MATLSPALFSLARRKLLPTILASLFVLAPLVQAQESKTTTSDVVVAINPEDQNLVIGLVGDLAGQSLNPQVNEEPLVDTIVYENVYQGLTHITSSGSLEMLLAERIAISKEGNKAIITLRDGVKWSDGSPLTSADVIANFDQMKSGENPDSHKFSHIAEYKAGGDKTVEVMISRPDPDFLYNLSTAGAALVKKDSSGALIGTGPYVLSVSSNMPEDNILSLTENTNYWAGTTSITNVKVQLLPNNDSARTGIQSGEIDFLPSFHDPVPAEVFKDNKDINVQVGFSEEKVILAMNNADQRLQLPLVRKAFAHAINKQTLSEEMMLKTAPIIGSHFSVSHVAHVDLSSSYPHSLEIAKKLMVLAEIEDMKFSLKVPKKSYLQRTAESIKDNLATAGIEVSIEELAPADFNTQVIVNKDFQLALVDHKETNDIGLYAIDNYMNYTNPYFSVAYNLEIRELDPTARNASLNILQRFLALDQPAVYLYQTPNINISKSALYGYRLHAPVNALILGDLFWDRK